MSLLRPFFCQYLGQVSCKLSIFFSVFTEQKKQKLSEVKAGLDDAESLVPELFAKNDLLVFVYTTSY